jgi:hypothetical protein
MDCFGEVSVEFHHAALPVVENAAAGPTLREVKMAGFRIGRALS